jgi:hypothetical protein
MLKVHGTDELFDHRDTNRLTKVAEPNLNAWLKIIKG